MSTIDTETHTCLIGPPCDFWSRPDVRNGSADDSMPECGHDSCVEIMYGYRGCYACQSEAYNDGGNQELFCPEGCGVVTVVDSGYNSGFAGEGFSWVNFSCGHGECG